MASWLGKIGLLALGGSAGTLARYALSGLTLRWLGSGFAWGTLAVNLLGSFLIGLGWVALVDSRLGPSAEAGRLLLLVGFLGAFTTFSTYMLETINLADRGQYLLAGANLLGSTIAGMVCVLAGMAVGRWI